MTRLCCKHESLCYYWGWEFGFTVLLAPVRVLNFETPNMIPSLCFTIVQLLCSIIRFVEEWNSCIAEILCRVIEGKRKCGRLREYLGWTPLSVSSLLFAVHNRKQWVPFISDDGVWHDVTISINCIMMSLCFVIYLKIWSSFCIYDSGMIHFYIHFLNVCDWFFSQNMFVCSTHFLQILLKV